MNLKPLIAKQQAFDQALAEAHQIKTKTWIEPALLALYVEVGELANEIQSFKYWKKNKRIVLARVQEEYADGLHFLLSFLNEFPGTTELPAQVVSHNVNQQFLAMFRALHALQSDFQAAHVHQAFSIYLGLGHLLNLAEADILAAYEQKNQINFERIKNNY